jgi:hypothetical protein
MRSSTLAWPAALVIAALAALGCKTNVSVDDPDPDPDKGCEDPKPEVPPGTFCPPAYACFDGEWVDTAGACPEPTCPASKPYDGTSCEVLGQVCSYQEDVPCGPVEQVETHCTATGWVSVYNYCQPEPECPDELPVGGTDCSAWAYYAYACHYNVSTSCGDQLVFLSCVAGEGTWTWKVDSPSTCAICKEYGSEAACAASTECQWLQEGCGDNPVQTGCYPKTGCEVSGCPTDDSVCVETSYNPCYNKLCDACGAPYFACLPAWAP